MGPGNSGTELAIIETVDKQQGNRKKRRARGEGVTSYRVTSSLTLTDEAYNHQQRAKQQRAVQPTADPYAQGGNDYGEGYYQGQNPGSYDANAQGYYDQNQHGYEQGYGDQQAYDQNAQGYYDPNQQGYEHGYSDQQAYDANAQGYYDQNQQGYDDQQAYGGQQAYDANAQGYYDPNQQGYEQGYSDQQAYDANAQGYYDQNQQGYYDQGYSDQQAYDQNAQGYYDQNQQGYYDQGYGDQQAYDQNAQGYYDQNQQGYYDQGYGDQQHYDQGAYPPETPKRKRKVESVRDVFSEMLGEGHVFATDSEESPYEEAPGAARPVYPMHGANGAYPPPHLVPASPLVQLLGPVAGFYFKLRENWKKLTEKMTYYTDMMLDMQESVQKEFKEAMGLAIKGFMDQVKQKSPLAPYQQQASMMSATGNAPSMGYAGEAPPQLPPVSFVDLQELNVTFTDNYDQALFDFAKYAHSQYKVSKQIVDPHCIEGALWSIRECAPRAGAIPPAQEGPYANLPLTEVMSNITEVDLQSFLRYVKAYPGNYVSRNLKISETFATWVVYGAPTP